ncbi:hypothetical protein BT93_K1874 [Corymbia citriodora subsp. variegata]|nr:hypothetical protein BT93_K1874 [Corymbia citriodora subsp. variegata]
MDAEYSGEMLKHLEKQNELLMEASREGISRNITDILL